MQRAIDVAFKYRNYFRKDIIVDLIVYRRWCVLLPRILHSPIPPLPPSAGLPVAAKLWLSTGATTSWTSRRSRSR